MQFLVRGSWRITLILTRASFSQHAVKKKAMTQSDLCYHFAIKTKKLAAKNRPDLAYGMISQALARSALTKPNIELFNTLISACAEKGELTLACDTYKMMRGRFVEPDSLTYLSLMDAYANAGNTLKKALMEPLSDAKRTHYMTRLLALFEEAQSKNLLSTPIFNVLLKGISWLGTLEHLEMMFPISNNEPLLVIPDQISYTTAILCVAYCGGSFRVAERYFDKMKANLHNGDGTLVAKDSVLAMLTAYKLAMVNEPQARSRIFRRARDFALFYGTYLTDSKVLDSFLNVCKFAKEYKYGLEMLEKVMSEKTVPIDDVLEKTRLSLLVFCKRYDEALQLFRLIKRPSRLLINSMLEGCRISDKLDDCMEIFSLFDQTPNLIPNIHSCEHAILCIIGPHYPKFYANDPLLEKRIEFLQRVLEIIWKKEKKLFAFFSHADLSVKLGHFCQLSQNSELQQVFGKIKSE